VEGEVVDVLQQYRTQVAAIPACSDPDFTNLLARYRAGDEDAGRAIAGSYLALALGLAESLPALPPGLDVLDAVQEANAGLVEALRTFTGATAEEFEGHARRTIHSWLSAPDTEG
jgi:DNA-directed RNA polymerase specialized sigma subunit